MNPEFPPLQFAPPSIRPRRRDSPPFNRPPLIAHQQRLEIHRRIQTQRQEIDRQLSLLTPEQKRAVFLRIEHDRPLTKNDLSGTDFDFMSPPGARESLVITRTPGLEKFDKRMAQFAEGDEPARPRGTEFAEKLRLLTLGKPKDRLSGEVLMAYDQWVRADWLTYEIEITSFKNVRTQKSELESIRNELRAALGHINGHIFEHEDSGRSCRIVLRSTGAMFQQFVQDSKWWQKITFFDERPRFETFTEAFENFQTNEVTIEAPAANAETICVIDSGVAGENPFLKPALRRDISTSFVYGCSPTEDAYGHGSGVASLAAYYNIEYQRGGLNQAAAFIASARVMTDDGQLDAPPMENGSEDAKNQARLLSSILREVVSHLQPRGVQIFVLSLEIVGHIWSLANRRQVARNAWTARTLDILSREYNVVFVTITGNVSPHEVGDLLEADPFPSNLLSSLAKVLDPGHAALAVTVGSIAHSARVIIAPHTAIADPGQPSPFTRSGPGFGDSIKPDFVERGGNLVLDSQTRTVKANAGTNVVMASGKLTPALQHHHGTSFAAPRVAHHLAVILRDLRALGINPSAPLLRAILGASAASKPDWVIPKDKDLNLALLGFGQPDGFAALNCAKHAALLYWQGEMTVNHTAIFRFNVPSELAGQSGKKRIVVSIASAPPVQPWGVAEYLGAEMKFRLFRGDCNVGDVEAKMQRDESEENVASKIKLKELQTELTISRRSRGTLQVDAHTWTKHETDFSSDDYTLGVALSPARWCKEGERVPVAVVVRVEDTTGNCEVLYERVKARNRVRSQERARITS
jgi:Subtilase family